MCNGLEITEIKIQPVAKADEVHQTKEQKMKTEKMTTETALWLCGHSDSWPVNLLKNKRGEIESRPCPECRPKLGHLGTGRYYMGEGKPTWAPGEVMPWLPANDPRQPKGVEV